MNERVNESKNNAHSELQVIWFVYVHGSFEVWPCVVKVREHLRVGLPTRPNAEYNTGVAMGDQCADISRQ